MTGVRVGVCRGDVNALGDWAARGYGDRGGGREGREVGFMQKGMRSIKPGSSFSDFRLCPESSAPRFALASGAEMGGALANEEAADGGAAAGAGGAGLAIGVQPLLVAAAFAARQHEMRPAAAERGAQVPNALAQHGADGAEQRRRLRGR